MYTSIPLNSRFLAQQMSGEGWHQEAEEVAGREITGAQTKRPTLGDPDRQGDDVLPVTQR